MDHSTACVVAPTSRMLQHCDNQDSADIWTERCRRRIHWNGPARRCSQSTGSRRCLAPCEVSYRL